MKMALVKMCLIFTLLGLLFIQCINAARLNQEQEEQEEDEDETATTTMAPSENCPKGKRNGLYPHPTNCSQFLSCSNGRGRWMSCQDGLHFNRRLKVCDYPEQAGCSSEGMEDTTPAPTEAPTTEASSGQEEQEEDGEEGQEQEEEGDNHVSEQCPNGDGMYSHPKSCRKFVHCENGTAYEKDCGPGTAWNDNAKICDYPENTDCQE